MNVCEPAKLPHCDIPVGKQSELVDAHSSVLKLSFNKKDMCN